MNVRLLTAQVLQSLRERGLAATAARIFTHLKRNRSPDAFDQAHGTNTGGVEPLWQYTIASPNARYGVRYQPSDLQVLESIVRYLHEDPHNFTFIDLGCGKGRMLLLAATLGFRRVIGVEFAAELVGIAEANASQMAALNISVLHADASEFQFPAKTDLMVYLFNPFEENILRAVMANLETVSGKLYVIYNNPRYADVLNSNERFERLGTLNADPFPIMIWKAVGRPSPKTVPTASRS